MSDLTDLAGIRVLVTGGLGFIGSNLAHALVGLKADVTIYDSLDPLCGGNRANIVGIEDRVRVTIGDIRSSEGVMAVVRGADMVVNCAAYTSHVRSLTDPFADTDVNSRGVLNVLEAVRREERPIRLIQLGTSTQVGRMLQEPVTEEHAEFPTDIYSANKSAAEKYVLIYGSAHGIAVSVLRLANVYGPRAKVTDAGLGFLNYFVGLALQDKDVPVYGTGAQRRTATYVDDVVGAILRASVSDAALGQVMFAASDRQFRVRELAEAIVRHIGRGRIRTVEWPADHEAIEVGDAVISSERIARLLGWRATTDLDEGLTATREYYEPRIAQYL